MTNQKTQFFKAVRRETGETIEFGLEDFYCFDNNKRFSLVKGLGLLLGVGSSICFGSTSIKNWLKDYDLFYFHQGEYYIYGK